jgi:hypothetical protein
MGHVTSEVRIRIRCRLWFRREEQEAVAGREPLRREQEAAASHHDRQPEDGVPVAFRREEQEAVAGREPLRREQEAAASHHDRQPEDGVPVAFRREEQEAVAFRREEQEAVAGREPLRREKEAAASHTAGGWGGNRPGGWGGRPVILLLLSLFQSFNSFHLEAFNCFCLFGYLSWQPVPFAFLLWSFACCALLELEQRLCRRLRSSSSRPEFAKPPTAFGRDHYGVECTRKSVNL